MLAVLCSTCLHRESEMNQVKAALSVLMQSWSTLRSTSEGPSQKLSEDKDTAQHVAKHAGEDVAWEPG